MEPLDLQQFAIAKGVLPYRQAIDNGKGQSFTRTETTDGVYSIITLVDKKGLAAHAFLKWRQPEALDIRDLHVEKKYRGSGLGTMLLDRIMSWAGTSGVTKIWGGIVQKDIDESPFLLEWYQRHGFTVEAPESHNFLPVKNEYSVWFDVAGGSAK